MEEVKITVVQKDYYPAQTKLIEMWNKYANNVANGIPDSGFVFTLPRNKQGERKKFNGLPIQHVNVNNKNRDVVRMKAQDFLLLMAKSGIEIKLEQLEIV